MNGLISVALFLTSILFSLVTFILWGRIFIRFFAISPFEPFSQTIFKITNPFMTPIQQYITRSKGTIGRYDVSSLLVLACCELIKLSLLNLIFLHTSLSFGYVLLSVPISLIIQPCNIIFFAIIVRVIISWVNPLWKNPLVNILFAITEPLLRLIRKRLPNTGMIDFSPLIAIVLLKCVESLCLSAIPFQAF